MTDPVPEASVLTREPTEVRIDEYSRDEWWDVCRKARPDLTEAAFDQMWEEFQAEKRAHE